MTTTHDAVSVPERATAGRLDPRRAARGAARRLTSSGLMRHVLRMGTMSGIVPPAAWKRLPVAATFSVRLPGRHAMAFRYRSIADDLIGRALFWRGLKDWEAETIDVFLTLARQARLLVDVGANTGVYALLACAVNPRAEVLAFEPVPHIHQHLRRNLDLNDLGGRCHAVAAAVADFTGTAPLHVPAVPLPTSATLGEKGFRAKQGSVVDVDVTTLDEACRGRDDVDVVKIDVEGSEHLVLGGMQRVLETCRPAIIIECNPDGPYREISECLAPLDYHYFHLQGGGPRPTQAIVPDASERYRNYLCLPEGKLDWINSDKSAAVTDLATPGIASRESQA